MTAEAISRPRNWQKSKWVQILAIFIGVGPVYIPTIMSHLQREQPLSVSDVSFYTTVLGSIMIVVMLLLLKYLCGERIRDLNREPGKWWQDILVGIGLTVVTLGTMMLLNKPINSIFPREPDSGLGDFFNELVQNPLLFGFAMGPMLIIGAGIFEELTRVFLVTRLWNMGSSEAWRWFSVALSAILFGLGHIYQGSAGAVSTGITGLILAVYYYRFGRIIPMMLSHYLHDAIQFIAIYLMANSI
jgi:membrane protease YdiL (CAAX protease family)